MKVFCAALALAAPLPVAAAPLAQVQAIAVAGAEGELGTFLAYDGPLWTRSDGSLDPAARALVELVESSRLDGIDPASLGHQELIAAIGRAERDRSADALADAELALSRTFVAYVAAMRLPSDPEMVYEHPVLQPHSDGAYLTLRAAAQSPSLLDYVRNMRWMHPLYGELRQALVDAGEASPGIRRSALHNLARLRAIPADPGERYVLVDIAGARLWMYENGRPVDSMRVVVGKPSAPTPSYAGYIRYAIANPYWNVPSDLLQSNIAPRVMNEGIAYLRRQKYEVLAGWNEDAELLDPAKVDWRAVRRGQTDLRVRQLPGPSNAMGSVKFEFPNVFGIYLHDTPERGLMTEEARFFSAGCIRLEDADKLSRWLLGAVPEADARTPEQRIDLERPVPIYITYLTARAENGRIALGPDPYARDAAPIELAHAN